LIASGKGIRDAPRDALIADIAPADLRGASYGLRQSLDTIGAVVGPLATIALMALSSDNFRFVFSIAVVSAFISLAVMLVVVPARTSIQGPTAASPAGVWRGAATGDRHRSVYG
jgi:MFS family permease